MKERLAHVEKRVGQLENSLSTAIQALTEILQARGKEKLAQPHIQPETWPPSLPAADLVSVQREHTRLAARVQTLEGYMEAVLAFVEAQEQERRGGGACPTTTSSPVLEERVVHSQRPPLHHRQLHAGDVLGIEGNEEELLHLVDARVRQQVALQWAKHQPEPSSPSPPSEASLLLKEMRTTALGVVEAALQQERDVARRERQSELAALRTALMERITGTSGAPAPRPGTAVPDNTEALERLVRNLVAEEVAAMRAEQTIAASPSPPEAPTPTTEPVSATDVAASEERVESRLAGREEGQGACRDAQQRSGGGGGAGDTKMSAPSGPSGVAADIRSLHERVQALEDSAHVPCQKESPREPQHRQELQQVRQELLSALDRRIRGVLLDVTSVQETAAAQQETMLAKLQEDQLSLRGAVRALVTPSAVLQSLDQRIRAVREDVKALQRQWPQQQQPASQPRQLPAAPPSPVPSAPVRRRGKEEVEPLYLSGFATPDAAMAATQPPQRPFKAPDPLTRRPDQQRQQQPLTRLSGPASRDLVNSRERATSSSPSSSSVTSVTEVSLDSLDTARSDHHQRRPHVALAGEIPAHWGAGEGEERRGGGGRQGGGRRDRHVSRTVSASSVSSATSKKNVSLEDALRGGSAARGSAMTSHTSFMGHMA